jgi:hypothetical protein
MSGEIQPSTVPGRSCDGCTMCCKLFDIPSVPKTAGAWCRHCDIGKGCSIYETRPQECRVFFCQYLLDASVPEHWRPSHSHMVVKPDPRDVRVMVHVDTGRAEAWRQAAYYRDLKSWAASRIKAEKFVYVRIGARTIVVLPDRDVDLGAIGDRAILARKTATPQGPRYEFTVLDNDDPRAVASLPQAPAIFRK